MTTGQAKKLKLKKGSRWSPYLEKCYLLVSIFGINSKFIILANPIYYFLSEKR